jgi:membrane peptidoglycan carboxypeptidase
MGADLSKRTENAYFLDLIRGAISFEITSNGELYTVQYAPGRKDESLSRMYQEQYIDQNELKEAFVE